MNPVLRCRIKRLRNKGFASMAQAEAIYKKLLAAEQLVGPKRTVMARVNAKMLKVVQEWEAAQRLSAELM